MNLLQRLVGCALGATVPGGVVTGMMVTGIAVVSMAALPAMAQSQGQVTTVAPYFVITTGDAVLRCGNLEEFYTVANLGAGQILRVDGESENWKRVAYPVSTGVFVAVDDAELSADGKTATLTRPSNLKAANAGRSGLKGSWKNVFDPTPLAAGTQLTVLKLEQTDDGKKRAYRVEAPEAARAYIHNGYVRRATDAEIVGAGFSEAADGAPVEPTATAPTTVPNGTTNPPAAPDAGAPAGTDLTDPQISPSDGSAPVEPSTTSNPAPDADLAPGERPIATTEQLTSALEEIRKQPIVTAEYDELIAEYQRAIDARGESDSDTRARAGLQQRLDWLRLCKDLQTQKIALEEARAAVSDAGKAAAAQVADVEKTRRYEVIGRLTTSTVYDGKRLPLMYRVQSVGDAVPRTLGYLRPDDKLELEKKIGQVVGVSGEPTMDKALKLNVLTAKRVDILEPQKQEAAPENR
jgi:hypothetical protein